MVIEAIEVGAAGAMRLLRSAPIHALRKDIEPDSLYIVLIQPELALHRKSS